MDVLCEILLFAAFLFEQVFQKVQALSPFSVIRLISIIKITKKSASIILCLNCFFAVPFFQKINKTL